MLWNILLFCLLAHGGDPNIKDEHHQTLLHRTAIHSSDPRMLYLLCENTEQHNATDAKGNTVLGEADVIFIPFCSSSLDYDSYESHQDTNNFLTFPFTLLTALVDQCEEVRSKGISRYLRVMYLIVFCYFSFHIRCSVWWLSSWCWGLRGELWTRWERWGCWRCWSICSLLSSTKQTRFPRLYIVTA